MSTLYRLLQTKEFMSDKTWVQISFIAQNKNKNVFMFLQWKWTGGGSGGQGVWHTVFVSVIIIYLLVIVLRKKIIRISLIKWVCQHRPHHMMYRFSKWHKCKETLQLFVHSHPPSSLLKPQSTRGCYKPELIFQVLIPVSHFSCLTFFASSLKPIVHDHWNIILWIFWTWFALVFVLDDFSSNWCSW